MSNQATADQGNVTFVDFGKRKVKQAPVAQDFDTSLYWQIKAKQLERVKHLDKGLFRGCSTLMGEPLGKESKTQILSYLNDPTLAAWLQIRSLLVADTTTLWQAWRAVDDNAPCADARDFPHPEVVREAIRHAVKARAALVERKLVECRLS